jgi:translocation and assembly module TamA
MTLRAAPLRALWWWWLTLALSGCANLPFFNDTPEDAAASEPLVAQYELEIDAPNGVRKILLDYLDIGRFRNAPRSDAVTSAELDRLARAAPAQARQLLETEGYFNAGVTIARSDGGAGLPLLTMHVVPGPRVSVARVAIDADEPLAARTPSPPTRSIPSVPSW